MLNNMRKFVLPDSVLTVIRDAVVDRLAENLDGKKRALVLKFHSDGKFRNALNAALERAVHRFAEEYEDQAFVDAVVRDTEFWSLKSVQEAVKEIVVRPSSYLESEFTTLRQTFAEVVPTVKPERVDAAVGFFLRCVSDEVLNIPQLAPIYQVQLQKISVQQGREMISVLKDSNDIQKKALIALLEVPVQQSKLLSISHGNLAQPDENRLQELKAKYFESILQKYEYMDMGGISPRVTSKAESRIVSIRMEDVFIPLKARGEILGSASLIQQLGRAGRATELDEEQNEEITVDEVKFVEEQTSFPARLDQISNEPEPVGIAKILENRKVVILGHPGAGNLSLPTTPECCLRGKRVKKEPHGC